MWTPPPDWKNTQKHAARPLMSQRASLESGRLNKSALPTWWTSPVGFFFQDWSFQSKNWFNFTIVAEQSEEAKWPAALFCLRDSVQAVDVLLLLQLNTCSPTPLQWIVRCTHSGCRPIWKTKRISGSNTDTNLFDCQLQLNSSVIHHFTSVEAKEKENQPIPWKWKTKAQQRCICIAFIKVSFSA